MSSTTDPGHEPILPFQIHGPSERASENQAEFTSWRWTSAPAVAFPFWPESPRLC